MLPFDIDRAQHAGLGRDDVIAFLTTDGKPIQLEYAYQGPIVNGDDFRQPRPPAG